MKDAVSCFYKIFFSTLKALSGHWFSCNCRSTFANTLCYSMPNAMINFSAIVRNTICNVIYQRYLGRAIKTILNQIFIVRVSAQDCQSFTGPAEKYLPPRTTYWTFIGRLLYARLLVICPSVFLILLSYRLSEITFHIAV